MAQNDKANPILVSNKALQQPQEATEKIITTTGTILYANDFSGINPVAMPDDWKEALNSDYGETGNNIIIQLQQKIQQMADGPWYVDSRDGVLYIHNRRFQEPSVAEYTYQSENGELLQVTFETQYVTKVIRASTSTGINQNKGLQTEVVGMGQTNVRMADQTYLEYFDPQTGAYKPQSIINAYNAGKLSYSSLLTLNDRVKQHIGNNRSAFTQSQWDQIRAIRRRKAEEQRRAQQAYTDQKYEEYQAAGLDAAAKYREQGITETLETKDLEPNVTEFLVGIYGSQGGLVQAELDNAARNGTLDGILKNRFQSTTYTFTNRRRGDGGATVEAWTETKWGSGINPHINRDDMDYVNRNDIDRNPYVRRIGEMSSDGYIPVFTKTQVEATVSGYRLLRAYYSRKYGASIDGDLSRRVLAAANDSRKITEKKLMAKAIVVGRPSLQTSQVINIQNVGKKWSGSWYIKKCVHKLEGSSGYTVELELTRHKAIEGHSAAVQSNHHGHSTSDRSRGGHVSAKSLTNTNLTSAESTYFNAASLTQKEDLIILKMAGVNDAVVPKGNTGDLSRTNKISFDMVRTPTAEERKKYGRAAAQAVDSGIKTTHK